MAKRVIKLLGEPIQNEDDKAAEVIVPGMLVAWNGSGNLIKHADVAAAAAGVRIACTFAMEREEAGADIDDAYAINDTVKVGHFGPGTRVNALVATAAPAIVKGDLLESAGNGTVRKRTTGIALARALEALTNVSGVNARLRIEII